MLDDNVSAIYHERQGKIVRDICNAALRDDLAPEQIESSLMSQIATEVVVASIKAKARDLTNRPIQLEPVRKVFADSYRQRLEFKLKDQSIKLVGISLNRPRKILSQRQRSLARSLSLKSPNAITLQIDQPQVRENINLLGRNVETIRFTAKLPLSLARGGKLIS